MSATRYVLSIDQGTTSTRAILFDAKMRIAAVAQEELSQHFPRTGWVEHDLDEIWSAVVSTSRQAMAKAGARADDIESIGITNQRETTAIWDRATGKPIHRAIVWQDRRTGDLCAKLKQAGVEDEITSKTGLLLDPYFSGTKIAWLLTHVEGAKSAAQDGRLAFGTIDSFLLWRLTGGKVHATDATNASRTLLMDLSTSAWDTALLEMLDIPAPLLPEIRDCAADFGTTLPELFGKPIRIAGIAGDQQAATVGQACFTPGMMKATYGTGCFALLNTGDARVRSTNRMLSTLAYQLKGKRTYAIEGSIFVAGAAVQWLRDGLGIIDTAAQSSDLAVQADDTQDVVLVPAFVGLGAPYWDADCRGALYGLSRNTGPNEIARAALESVAFQTRDLAEAMLNDWGSGDEATVLRVDGGMVASDWTMQRIADILDADVDRPHTLETTALGAAWLAGQQVGFYPSMDVFAAQWSRERRFKPSMPDQERERRYSLWKAAVARTLSQTGSPLAASDIV
ncbi:MAG: glycerol kinase GlpK [Hyphomicrobiaceae bacterium]